MLGEVESEIFLKYKNALVALGVDLADESVIDCIEGCNYNLEPKFQAIISYWCWRQNQGREVGNANQLLLEAFAHNWTPLEWQDEFLQNPHFTSPAQKWWSTASQVEVLKNLIVDVRDNFWSAGDTWTMDLDRARDLSWSQLLAYYQRVTNTKIDSNLHGYTIHQRKN